MAVLFIEYPKDVYKRQIFEGEWCSDASLSAIAPAEEPPAPARVARGSV